MQVCCSCLARGDDDDEGLLPHMMLMTGMVHPSFCSPRKTNAAALRLAHNELYHSSLCFSACQPHAGPNC